MRYIDTSEYEPSKEWLREAEKINKELMAAASDEERKGIVAKNSSLWSELKLGLSAVSHQKCWYCESRQVRSDNAVDHFRPKSRVHGVKDHNGYWWLAFTWTNYRYICTFCNSLRKSESTQGGKQDFFPLRDEKNRAKNRSDELDREEPTLLDPTNIVDVNLLIFSEDGSVGAAMERRDHSFDYERAANSIKRYHLTHPSLVEQREQRIREVARWIQEADRYLDRYAATGEMAAMNVAESRMRDVRKRALEKAEYSTAVKHFLLGMVSSVTAQNVYRTL